jgi:putative redox protein
VNIVTCTTETPGAYPHRIAVRAHQLITDLSAPDSGDAGPDGHDLFDASLASCKATTAMWFAKRHGWPLESVDVRVERDGTEERKGTYKLALHIGLYGPLSDEQRDRIYAAIEKCPIHKLMTTTDVVVETVRLAAP